MRQKKILMFVILLPAIFSCTKVENGYIVPQSAPYRLNTLNNAEFSIKFNQAKQILSVKYDNQWVFQSLLSEYDTTTKYKIFSLLIFGYPWSYIEQVNFPVRQGEPLESVFMIPLIDDFNNNHTVDQIYFVVYKDKYCLQLRDQIKLIYPSSQSIENNDLFKELVISEKGINGFKLYFKGIWKYSGKKAYILFQKSNRLLATSSKETDTLIFINPYNLKIKKLPFLIGNFINSNGFLEYTSLSYPLLFEDEARIPYLTAPVKNGHNFDKLFNDFNQYLITFDTSLNAIVVDTLWAYMDKSIIVAMFCNSNNFYLIKLSNIEQDANSFYLYQYSFKDSKLISTKKIEFPYDFHFFLSTVEKQTAYLFSSNELVLLNLNNLTYIKKKLPFNIEVKYKSPQIIKEEVLPSFYFSNFIDLNLDGSKDLICLTAQNQLVGYDFVNQKILFASEALQYPYDFSVGYSNNKSPIFLIKSNDKSNIYLLEPNNFWDRLLSYYSYFTLVAFAIFIPLALVFLSYSYIILVTLNKLSFSNEILGLCLFGTFGPKNTLIPLYYNETYSNFLESINKYNDFEKIVGQETKRKLKTKNLINNLEKLKKEKLYTWETYYFDETKEKHTFRFVATRFSLFKIFQFILIQLYETTDIEKKEHLIMLLNTIHNVKTNLSAIQNTFENINYLIVHNRIDKETSNEYFQQILLLTTITKNNLMKMLYVSNEYKPNQTIIELNELIQDWLENFRKTHFLSNIIIQTDFSSDRFEYKIDGTQILCVLDSILENSVNSLITRKNGIITIKTYKSNQSDFHIEIEDNGPGFDITGTDPKQQTPKKYNSSNTGVGLKIARKILDIYNVKLDIYSKINFGTKVVITFRKENEN